MSQDIVVKTGKLPLISLPEGASVEFSIPIDAIYPLADKHIEFGMQTGKGRDPKFFKATSASGVIMINDQVVSIIIPPATVSEVEESETTLSDVSHGLAEYRIDFLSSLGGPVDFRLQGDLNWIQKEGDWTS